ncbi:ABC transporter permease [Rhodococcus sp. ARC_M6]|uniref:ABC transporter permease n=1 Tax=Rhodococcus sp. ARC_M6 TaxID=2928852 RepID=UPI001FB205DD|nr:ABC transporter permease [Rhodococcus sp. ARC_M6]MCJ0906836.1 ABC transporter permease [Rhodococcus sp. ARC_M6]
MFVAMRDLRAARGRFALISVVVLMVALLVSFLSGLTAGLRHQNVSAIESMKADTVVFADTGSGASFDESAITADQLKAWTAGAKTVDPVGIARGKAGLVGSNQQSVSLFGADSGFGDLTPGAPGTVVLSEGAARDLGAAAGDRISVGADQFTVTAVRGDDWYSHTPVVWMTLGDWQDANPRGGVATILAVSGASDASAINSAAGTTSTTVSGSLQAIGSYAAENGSLTLMTFMLFAISALVIGAFFTVWTIQRMPDVATLKALGATTGSLVRDALGQAFIVLLIGVSIGIGLTAIAGTLMGGAMPFVLSLSTTLVPALALIGLGLVGAAFALRFLVTTDPLTALGSTR